MIEIIVVKMTLLLVLAWTVTLALRNRSAATRHFVWCAALFGCAGLLLALALPPVHVPVWKAATPATAFAPQSFAPVAEATNVVTLRTAVSAPVSRESRLPMLSLAYLAGALGVLLWTGAGHFVLARIARRARLADGYHLSQDISAPLTWGRMIFLPLEAASWPEERREAALLHERAHIARHDFPIQLAARLVCALFWFHPLVWLALRRLRMESEHACDDRVLAAGMVPADYASHLLAVARGALTHRHSLPAALAMARPSELESRLLSVLDGSRSRGNVSRNIAIVAAVLVGVAILPVAFAARNETNPPHKVERGSAPSPTISHAFPASPGETLTFDLKTGASIEILGWDEPRVTVETTLGGRDATQAFVSANRASNGVRITSDYEGRSNTYSTSIHMAIRAPRKSNVELFSAGGGLTLTDLDGTFSGTTGGGNIIIDRSRGAANLTTGGGEIRVTDSHLSGGISTGGGEAHLTRVTGGLDATSGSGPVIHDDEDDRGTAMSIAKPGGAIRIGAKRGNVNASTGGGDITIGPVAGSVHASTGAGDVEVTVVDANGIAQNVDVSSGNGRIEVTLPANFDARFDIESAFTADAGPTTIESDWELTRSTTPTFDDREGTPRRYVRARGTVGSGRGLVRIKTVNGDVVVRRSAK